MKKLIFLFILLLLLCGCRKCCQGHYELFYHSAWTEIKPVFNENGSISRIFIFHPAYNSKEFICDKYCDQK